MPLPEPQARRFAALPADRRRDAALVLAAVLAAHALLLSRYWPAAGAQRQDAPRRPAVVVRQAATLVRADPAVPAPRSAPAARPSGVPPLPLAPRAVTAPPPRSAAPRVAAAAIGPPQPALPASAAAQPAGPPPAAGPPIPTYPTRIAPAFSQAYALRRGAAIGSADLDWQPAADGYRLELRGEVQGVEAIGLLSRGGFDAAGLAPERLVDRRRGRERAANFERAKGLITFSGPQVSHALAAGTQDRLSWMLQLGAIVEADPGRFGPGERITLFVAGVHGDGQAWEFTVLGRGPVELADGSAAEALHLRREPARPYDTVAEAWLDPARGHRPLKVRLDTVPATQALELVLRP
jgi:hypothetical protein